MSENDINVKEKTASSPLIRWSIFAAIVIIAFLVGIIPMMMQKWAVQTELAATQTQLRKAEMKNLLTSSIVEANRGEYEPARQNMTDFFQKLRAEDEKADEGFLTQDQRGKIKPIFDSSYAVITMLAQRDQASVERLTNVYSTYQQAMGVTQPPTTAPPANTNANTAITPATTPAANTNQ